MSDDEIKKPVPSDSSDEEFTVDLQQPDEYIRKNICHRFQNKEQRAKRYSIGCILDAVAEYIRAIIFVALGILYFLSHLSVNGLIESYVPAKHAGIYFGAIMMVICGISCFVLKVSRTRKRSRNYHRILVWSVFILSIICTIFCVASLVYLIAVIKANLDRLEGCEFDETVRSCLCMNSDRTKRISLAQNKDCNAVKDSLNNLALGVGVLFGVGFLVSAATTYSAFYLLRKESNDRRQRVSRNISARRGNRGTRRTRDSRRKRRHPEERLSDISVQVASTSVNSPPMRRWRAASIATQTDQCSLSPTSCNSSEYSFDGISPPSYNDAIKSLRENFD